MAWIYLSPHFDDVVFSCGGLIWEQTRGGQRVEIWTVCGGDPPGDPDRLSPYALGLHRRWENADAGRFDRSEEDHQACLRLRAVFRHLPYLDCIYRGHPEPIVQSDADLFDPAISPETELVDHLAREIVASCPQGSQLVSPLGIGGHLDHRLTRQAADHAWRQLGLNPLYYAEIPYDLEHPAVVDPLTGLPLDTLPAEITPSGLSAWQDAVLAYRSQLSTFWEDEPTARQALAAYQAAGGGCLRALRRDHSSR